MTRRRATFGLPTDSVAKYYAQRASAGLVITEATHISADTVHSNRSAAIHDEQHVAAWLRVSCAVHAAGGRVFLQLWHLGRAWHGGALPPLAPSAVAARMSRPDAQGVNRPLPVPRALDGDGIATIVQAYRQAAGNAIRAGMNGVEVQAANGFLIDQFLRDGSNLREDEYGGTPQRRSRFLLEVVEAICAEVGAERVGVRLSPAKAFNDMHDSTPFATFGHAVRELGAFGLAYLHLAGEAADGGELSPGTKGIEQHLRSLWKGPLILNGGFTRERALEALERGKADLVSFATAYIANPDLVRRFETGATLNALRSELIYQGEEAGYVDYPVLAPSGTEPA